MSNALHDLPGTHKHQATIYAHAASTSTEKIMVWEAPFDAVITDIKVIPAAAISGADTNTTHLNFIDEGADGSGTTEIDAFEFVSGFDGVEGKAISGSTTDVDIDEGDVVSVQIEKVGNGLALPQFHVVIEYEAR